MLTDDAFNGLEAGDRRVELGLLRRRERCPRLVRVGVRVRVRVGVRVGVMVRVRVRVVPL